MAGDPLRLLSVGDRIRAGEGPFNVQWHNQVTEAVKATQRETIAGQSAVPVDDTLDEHVWVANPSAEPIGEYTAVGIAGFCVVPDVEGDFRGRLCLLACEPADGAVFGIAQGPITAAVGTTNPVPGVGKIKLSGETRARVYVVDSAHRYASIIGGELRSHSNADAAQVQIVVKSNGTGYQWALVVFCCATITPRTNTGTAEVAGPVGTVSGDGQRLGGIVAGPVGTVSASGTSTPPTYSGIGDVGGMVGIVSAVGHTFGPPSTGQVFGPLGIVSATGTVVNPPQGLAIVSAPIGIVAAVGTSTGPICTGSGAVTGPTGTADAFGLVFKTAINSLTALDSSGGIDGVTGPAACITESVAFTPRYLVNGTVESPAELPLMIFPATTSEMMFDVHAASLTRCGVVSIVAQSFAGAKTFQDTLRAEIGVETEGLVFYGTDKRISFAGTIASPSGVFISATSTDIALSGTRPKCDLNANETLYFLSISETGLGSTAAEGIASRRFMTYDGHLVIGGAGWYAGTTGTDPSGNYFSNGLCLQIGSGSGSIIDVAHGGLGADNSASVGIPTFASGVVSFTAPTTVGTHFLTLTNPSAVTFIRINADNTVSALSASAFRTAIGAGTGSGDLLAANNLSDLASASTARTNLGLGSLATQSGTFSGTSSGTNTGDQTITLTGDVTGSGTGSFAATIAAGAVTESKQTLSDVTTLNVSTTKHGYAPKLPNDATKYLDGTGAYSVPSGAGSVTNVSNTDGSITVATGTTTPVVSITQAKRGYTGGSWNIGFTYTASAGVGTVTLTDAAGNTLSSSSLGALLFQQGTGLATEKDLTAAATLTLSSSATLGAASTNARIWIVAFNDAGTVRLGAINCKSLPTIYPLYEALPRSSTAISGSATSAGVFYTGTAVTSKYYRIIGYIEFDSWTPGTWVAASRAAIYTPGMPLPGHIVQCVRASLTTVATGTTTVPLDDTKPQKTEGDQYLTCSITPISAANCIQYWAEIPMTANGNVACAASLYIDSDSDPVETASVWFIAAQAGYITSPLVLRGFAETRGATSQTYKLRAGGNTGTLTVNGSGGTRYYGGACETEIDLWEIMS